MEWRERMTIIQALKPVTMAIVAIDKDDTVCESLEKIKPDVFTNGGDRHNTEIPEAVVCRKYEIELLDGMGDKIRSSSDLTGLKSK